MTDINNLLYDLYYTNKNFDGTQKLFMKAKEINKKIKFTDVDKWLKKQATYQLNYSNNKTKVYFPIYSNSLNSYQIDLTFLPRYKKTNNNYYILFTAIGINNRYAYVDYSKDKKSDTILSIFKKFFNEVKYIHNIDGDLGSEFTNKKFIKYLNENKIQYDFFKSDSHKLGIINRFHRTLKDKLTKYFIANDTVKWIDVIDTITLNYNNTYHRGIKAKPIEIFNNDMEELLLIENKKYITDKLKQNEEQFNINDLIRYKLNKVLFNDKISPKYSDTIYTIKKVLTNSLLVVDDKNKQHTFKKNKVLKINEIENYKNPNNINKAKKDNKISQIIQKEGIIELPQTKTRLRPQTRINYTI